MTSLSSEVSVRRAYTSDPPTYVDTSRTLPFLSVLTAVPTMLFPQPQRTNVEIIFFRTMYLYEEKKRGGC